MILFSEMFVSELIGKPVIDCFEEHIGKVKDVLVTFGNPGEKRKPSDSFPKVSGLLVDMSDTPKDKVFFISDIDLVGRQLVSLKCAKERLACCELRADDILLCRDFLDKQIVDIQGARVVRVNDIKMAKVDSEIRLIAADIGLTGIYRRLGLEPVIKGLFQLFRRKYLPSLIGWNYLELVRNEKLKGGELTIPHKRVDEMHPADIASIISDVRSRDRTAIFADLSDKTAAEALHELSPKIQAYLLTTIETKKAMNVLERMPADEAADVLGDIPDEKEEEFLRLMKKRKAKEIRKLLKHHDETAGGLMTTEIITLPQNQTVEETINILRDTAPSAETIYYLYVVDESKKLVGILSLRALIVSKPSRPISEIMVKDFVTVTPEVNQKKVAEIISKYNLLALPVVNAEGAIQGIVTVDDVIDFILPPLARRKRQMLG
jgi:magnesium transporter